MCKGPPCQGCHLHFKQESGGPSGYTQILSEVVQPYPEQCCPILLAMGLLVLLGTETW